MQAPGSLSTCILSRQKMRCASIHGLSGATVRPPPRVQDTAHVCTLQAKCNRGSHIPIVFANRVHYNPGHVLAEHLMPIHATMLALGLEQQPSRLIVLGKLRCCRLSRDLARPCPHVRLATPSNLSSACMAQEQSNLSSACMAQGQSSLRAQQLPGQPATAESLSGQRQQLCDLQPVDFDCC